MPRAQDPWEGKRFPMDNYCDDPERCETCGNWEMAPAYDYTLASGAVIRIYESMKCVPFGVRVHKCWRRCPIWAPRE